MVDATNFKKMPTHELVTSTKHRARDVDKVNDRAFDAVIPAFLSAVPLSMAIANFVVWGDRWTNFVWLLLALMVAFPFWHAWWKAIRNCKSFTAEMKARTRELNLRNS